MRQRREGRQGRRAGTARVRRIAGWGLLLLAVGGLSSAVSGQPAAEDAAVQPASPAPDAVETAADSIVAVTRVTEPALGAQRPRFSPDGQAIVFFAGPEGDADLYRLVLDGSAPERLTEGEGDDRDPAYTADGRIVWSSNREGSYDLYVMNGDGGETARLTDFAGDEREPAPGPVPFEFSAVGPGICGSPYTAQTIDTYQKIAYTREQTDGSRSIWVEPLDATYVEVHRHPISPEGQRCHEPAWSGNGLSLAFTCGADEAPIVHAAEAVWTADLAAAVAMLEYDWEDPASYCRADEVESDSVAGCFERFPREYARYPGEPRSVDHEQLRTPAWSANQTLLVGVSAASAGGDQIVWRPRGEGAWTALDVPGAPHDPVWSPDGTRLAFSRLGDGGTAIYLAETDFYLQEVRDLVDYPELYAAGRSDRLHRNRFVARPGEQRELFALYDQIEYARRSPFVTVDAVLQAFHDEFARLLRESEHEASDALLALSRALREAYAADFAASGSPRDRYLAVTFAVPAVLLEAAQSVAPTDPLPVEFWLVEECERIRALVDAGQALEEADQETLRSECPTPVTGTPVEQIAAHLDEPLAAVPEALRVAVREQLDAVLAHAGVGELTVPGVAEPVFVDYTQFQVRGHYAGSGLAGYFLAMMWYGLVPLPLDESSVALLQRLEETPSNARGRTLHDDWAQVDALVGAFMGRPVDVTLRHLAQLRHDSPELLSPWDDAAIRPRLAELRGPIPFRGLAGALGEGEYPLQLTLFPRRVGHDVTFFTALTHPDVELRGMPSALDVAAALGSERAREHAQTAAAGEEWADAYRAELERLAAETHALGEPFWSTDLYHGWLAMLRTLAVPLEHSESARLHFAASPAWHDRELLALLAGYTQLKHDAVLYAFQEYGVQCGDEPIYLAFVERPVQPPPRGFVEPRPDFFRAAAALALRVYADLAGGEAPDAYVWTRSDTESVNVHILATRLAELAEQEVRGEALAPVDEEWLRAIGPILEVMLLGDEPDDSPGFGEDEGRMERGVALVTDIYTNVQREEVLQIAIGRLLDLYVAVPDAVGQRMTQGGILSWYEFTHPMSDRLTDEAWGAMLEAGEGPGMPEWVGSFVEEGP